MNTKHQAYAHSVARKTRTHRGLFRCRRCGKAIHADVVGALNIARKNKTIIPNPIWRDRDNGLMAEPLPLRWNGMKWEPKRAMNTEPMKTLEAETEPTKMMVESHTLN